MTGVTYTYNLVFRYDPQVGYCQGLSFIVAVLLLNVSPPHVSRKQPMTIAIRCQMNKHFAS